MTDRSAGRRLLLATALLFVAATAVLAQGCGRTVPAGAIAAVGDSAVSNAQFDQLISQTKAEAKSSGTTFPDTGSATYKQYAAQIVTYLVQEKVIEEKAAALGLTVSETTVNASFNKMVSANGGKKKVRSILKGYGMTMADLKDSVYQKLLAQKVYDHIIAGVKVSEQELRASWKKNASSYQQKETRTTRHILVKAKATAQKVRALLLAGSSWKKVARQYSTDPGTKTKGGNLGAITKGEMVAAFEKAAFSLRKGVISGPVKTQYGWHIIEVTAITPAKSVTYKQARSQLQQSLLQQKQQSTWTSWLEAAVKDANVVYAVGYDPATLTASPSASASSTSG